MPLTKATNRMTSGAAINVKDHGAVGDGVTDDTVAIQAALDYGFNIKFPIGNYLISSVLVLRPKHHLIGSGMAQFINADNTVITDFAAADLTAAAKSVITVLSALIN